MTPAERAAELLAQMPPMTDEQAEQAARYLATIQPEGMAA